MKAGVDYIGVSVGALILNEKGEIFLNKRSKLTRNEQDCWEAPGGAVDFNETREDAVKREIKEEFGVEIKIIKILHVTDEILPKHKQHWLATTYIAKIKKGQKPKIMEPHKCDGIGWFSLDNLPSPLSYITALDIKAFKKTKSQSGVEEFLTKVDAESSYIKLLEKTKGTWKGENWETFKKRKRKIELKASKTRKKIW